MDMLRGDRRFTVDLTRHPRYIGGKGSLVRDLHVEAGMVLGSGMSGDVRLATSRGAGCVSRTFAVKSLQKRSQSQRNPVEEVGIHLAMNHPHIVTLDRVYEDNAAFHLVMERLEGGEMYDRLEHQGRYSEAEAATAMRQILSAVAYLHAQGVVHRDLKLENFLYVSSDSDRLKLIDFGLAVGWRQGSKKLQTCCGTLDYAAPEVLRKVGYTDAADLWSLGVVAYVLLTGFTPWSNSETKTTKMILAGLPRFSEARFLELSAEAQDFVRGLLTVDPASRLTAVRALQHPWLRTLVDGSARFDCALSDDSCGQGEDADEVATVAGSDSDDAAEDFEQLVSTSSLEDLIKEQEQFDTPEMLSQCFRGVQRFLLQGVLKVCPLGS